MLAERDASTKLLEELTRTLEKIDAMKCDFRVVIGNPFSGITQAARNLGADLIVIGTCGRSVIARARMGSVTEGVLRNSDQDVLAIPPPQNEAVS